MGSNPTGSAIIPPSTHISLGQMLGLPEAVGGIGLAAAPVMQIPRKHEDRGVAIAKEGV